MCSELSEVWRLTQPLAALSFRGAFQAMALSRGEVGLSL